MFVLFLICFILACVFYKQSVSHLNVYVDKIPGPRLWPVISLIIEPIRTPTDFFQWALDLRATYGPIFRVWAISKPKVVICTADHAEKVLRSPACSDKGDDYRYLHEYLSSHCVLVNDGQGRRVQRSSLLNSLRPCDLPDYNKVFCKHSVKLAECLTKDPENDSKLGVDMFKHASYCSADTMFECSLGYDMGAQDKQLCDYVSSVQKLCGALTWRYITLLRIDWLYYLSLTKRHVSKHINSLDVIMDNVFKIKKSKNIDDDIKLPLERCCIDYLSDKVPNQESLHKITHGLILAGYETTSSALSWLLFLLGTNPEVKNRVVEELESVFGESGRSPDMADLVRLEYLEMCIKETIRLYPSIFFVERKVSQDLDLGDYVLPAGCDANIHLYLLHRDPQVWPDPEKFDPERFSPENSQGRHPYAFLPFSTGPKGCVGPKFAIMEMKVMASTLLRRFDLAVGQKREHFKLKVGLILQPDTPIRVRFIERVSQPKLRVSEVF